jgi:hypothetical protein
VFEDPPPRRVIFLVVISIIGILVGLLWDSYQRHKRGEPY